MHYQHLIFDLDGTLLDTLTDIHVALNHALGLYERPAVLLDETRCFVGRGARQLVEDALGLAHHQLTKQVLDAFISYYAQNPTPYTTMYPGIFELLGDMKAQGGTASVLTNKPYDLAKQILRLMGLCEFFPHIIGSDTLPVRKPDPAGILHLIDCTGIHAAKTLMIGDTLIDVETARQANVDACGVLWGFDPEGVLQGRPRYLAKGIQEIRAALGI